MNILLIVGVISLFFGIMFLFFPGKMRMISQNFSKAIVNIDEALFRMHIGIGICMIAVGVACIFLVYYYTKKCGF